MVYWLATVLVSISALLSFTFGALTCTCPVQNTTTVARLVGGSVEGEGRLELLHEGSWGTVCTSRGYFTDVEADVVCRQLGYQYGSLGATAGGFFESGTGTVLLDVIHCRGHENSLTECEYTPFNWGRVDRRCRGHGFDAGVICRVSEDDRVQLRLSGGSTAAQGRLEVGLRGKWGYVCDSLWDRRDADVACRQLGYPGALQSISGKFWGPQGFPAHVFTDKVQCHGGESNFVECSRNIWGLGGSGCSSNRTVNLVCDDPYNRETIRLVGGASLASGRVEVGFNASQATICDGGWDRKDADVVCRALGYDESLVATVSSAFGGGDGWVWTDDTGCLGEEGRLSDCPGKNWGLVDNRHCSAHNHDVGVICRTSKDQDAEIRLVGGTHASQGRVEIGLDGAWGTVCDAAWDLQDATVVCRHLGYGRALVAAQGGVFGEGSGRIWTQDVDCTGSEGSLLDCPNAGWGAVASDACSHGRDAGVICEGVGQEEDFIKVRLSGASSGRVEIGFRNNWGTVCARGWDGKDAAVVCRQLGFTRAFAALARSSPGRGRIWTSNAGCHGSEDSILDCPTSGWGNPGNCTHEEDAGVVCGNDTSAIEVRLVGGNGSYGTVEVGFGGMWGSICHNSWDQKEADVVCRMLGYSRGLAVNHSTFGQSWGRILMSDLDCNGEEASIADCSVGSWGREEECNHAMDAGVICLRSDTKVDVRLVGGSDASQGRVEMGFYGAWGRVCDGSWDIQAARVVCRMLGYPYAIAAVGPSTFGDGHGRVWVNNVRCSGEERTLLDCPLQGWSVQSCRQGDYAGAICSLSPPKLAIRLVGGPDHYSGRVEVGMNGTWGTICDSGWDILDADVVCRELGFEGDALAAVRGAQYGAGTGRIWTSLMGCKGEERSLMDCSKGAVPRWGAIGRECNHNRDAGVACKRPDGLPGLQARLMRSPGESEVEGRVLVGLNGAWGAICFFGWTIHDANVVCRHLGYASAESKTFDNVEDSWPGRVWLQDLRCKGDERTLLNCSHGGWGVSSKCSGPNQFKLARVVCSNEPTLEQRARVAIAGSAVAVAAGEPVELNCTFGGFDLSSHRVTWRVAYQDVRDLSSAKRYSVGRQGNSSLLYFRETVPSMSGNYSCQLTNHPTVRSKAIPVLVLGDCQPGLSNISSRLVERPHLGVVYGPTRVPCQSLHPLLSPGSRVQWVCSGGRWRVDLAGCTLRPSVPAHRALVAAYLHVVNGTASHRDRAAVLQSVKTVFESRMSAVTDFRGAFTLSGEAGTAALAVTMVVDSADWDRLTWESFDASFIRLKEGIVFTSNESCQCSVNYSSGDSAESLYVAEVCRGVDGASVTPCTCQSAHHSSSPNGTPCEVRCSPMFTEVAPAPGRRCSLDTDGDGTPDRDDDCEFCCLEENHHGYHWPKSSHGIRVSRRCNKLHDFFSQQAMVTRLCVGRGGKWGHIDYSACTLKPGASRIVGIVEVATIEGRRVDSNSVVAVIKSNLSSYNPSNFATVSNLVDHRGNNVVTISLELPLTTSENVLQALDLLPFQNLSYASVPLMYAFKPSDSCLCRPLPSLWLPSFILGCTEVEVSTFPVVSLAPPCICLQEGCQCLDPFARVFGSTQCSLDKDADQIPDIEDDSVNMYNGLTEHTGCEVDQLRTCPESFVDSDAWSSTQPCHWSFRRCSRIGHDYIDIGVSRRFCNGSGVWMKPDHSACHRRDFWTLDKLVLSPIVKAIFANPRIQIDPPVPLADDHGTTLTATMDTIRTKLKSWDAVLYARDVYIILSQLQAMKRVYDVVEAADWRTKFVNSSLAVVDLLLMDKFSSAWQDQDKINKSGPHTAGQLMDLLETLVAEYRDDSPAIGRHPDEGISKISKVGNMERIGTLKAFERFELGQAAFSQYWVTPGSYKHDTLVFKAKTFGDFVARQPVIRVPRELLLETSETDSTPEVKVVLAEMRTPELFSSSTGVKLTKAATRLNGKSSLSTRTTTLVMSCQIGRPRNESVPLQSLIETPLELVFPSNAPGPVTSGDCVYWQREEDGPGFWSDVGVDTVYEDNAILCRSRHLSIFTVLFNASVNYTTENSTEDARFNPIKYTAWVAVPMSMVVVLAAFICMLVALRCVVVCELIYFIRVCFSITLSGSLVMATGSYFLGSYSNAWVCLAATWLQQYCLISAFSWLLCEGIQVFRLIVMVPVEPKRCLFFLLYNVVGWGVPLLIVGITVSTRYHQFSIRIANPASSVLVCWLSYEEGALAAFVVPVIAANVAVVVLLVLDLKRLHDYAYTGNNKKASSPSGKELVDHGRDLLKGHILVTLITSFTWLAACLSVNMISTASNIGWLYFIFMLFQGSAVFVSNVVLDSRVRRRLNCKNQSFADNDFRVKYHVDPSDSNSSIVVSPDENYNPAWKAGPGDNTYRAARDNIPITANPVQTRPDIPRITVSNVSDDEETKGAVSGKVWSHISWAPDGGGGGEDDDVSINSGNISLLPRTVEVEIHEKLKVPTLTSAGD